MEKFLFMIPLFFQVVLLDSASKAGIRLVIPSLSTPVGGLIAGFVMSRWGILGHLVRLGCFLMMLGNGLVASLQYQDSTWKYIAYLFPANLGQGIVYPSILFTNIAFFEQSGRTVYRAGGFDINGLPIPLHGNCLGRRRSLRDYPKYFNYQTT
jgi:hypothetical protein